MTNAQQSLRLYIFVCYDSHDGRHENGHDTLYGIEPRNLISEPGNSQIVSHASQISSPYSELNEVHDCKSCF